jgi:acylphosphatase
MSPTEQQVRRRFIITGQVQGVGYRYNLRHQAKLLGITGWCRNLLEGQVEAEVFGPAESIETLLIWCQSGPPAAKVSEVVVHELPLDTLEPLVNFEIRRSC